VLKGGKFLDQVNHYISQEGILIHEIALYNILAELPGVARDSR
jgi:hypothetical protein